MSASSSIRVEVAYARPERQVLLEFEVPEGCRVKEAIEQSGILRHFPEIDLASASVGIFSRKATLDDALRDGDRVEIYRPLLADPKEVRREMAERKKAEAAARKRASS